ncbi:MAG: hypothetical protein M5U14_01720 [Acidimicrobiia bacterium]|nr:hypothetical protein [Acidimicrobiia bacterium]
MTLRQCPYDGSPIIADAYAGGFVVVHCDRCGGQWELHNALIRRVRTPDAETVQRARAEVERRRTGIRAVPAPAEQQAG